MKLDFSFLRLSLKAKLISDYLVILGIGGLATSLLGSWIVSSAIMMQAHRAVDHDLAMARTLYEQRLESVEEKVELAASGAVIQQRLAAGNKDFLPTYLDSIRKDNGFDFLAFSDAKGQELRRVAEPLGVISDVSSIGVVRAALSGKAAAGTEVLSAGILNNPGASLRAEPLNKSAGASDLVMIASAPVVGTDGSVLGALYGGVLLNQNFTIVDRIWETA
jgi:hypothetical protein